MKDTNKDQQATPAAGPPTSNKKRAFFLPSNITAIKFTELDQCCCADVPCLSILKEYCESRYQILPSNLCLFCYFESFSSLHGLKYITEDGRHVFERILWFLLCFMGFILTIYFILPIWIKWNSQPTLTTLDSTNHPVWEIDFPAVTICSPNKVLQAKLEDLAAKSQWKNAMDATRSDFSDLKELFDVQINFKKSHDKLNDLNPLAQSITSDQIAEALLQVMPNCSDFIRQCWWQGNLEDCDSIFELRKTDDGFCCSFNALRQSETIDL